MGPILEPLSPAERGLWPWPGAVAPYDFRFFPEFGAETPFWCGLAVVPIGSMGLSVGLAAQLALWCEEYELQCDTADLHWKPGAKAWRDFNACGRALCALAQAELGSDYVLTYEEWN